MKVILKVGVLIGALCALWVFVMGFTGWYKHPALLNAFWVVVLIQIGLLVWGLRQTAAENTYGRQVGAGTLMSLIAGVILFFNSLLFTSVVFPEYFTELRAVQEQMMRAAGTPEDQVTAALEAAKQSQTPLIQAVSGLVGTTVTGLVASLIIAIFARAKKPA
jgi:Protein of unknown function (DUF4199)